MLAKILLIPMKYSANLNNVTTILDESYLTRYTKCSGHSFAHRSVTYVVIVLNSTLMALKFEKNNTTMETLTIVT